MGEGPPVVSSDQVTFLQAVAVTRPSATMLDDSSSSSSSSGLRLPSTPSSALLPTPPSPAGSCIRCTSPVGSARNSPLGADAWSPNSALASMSPCNTCCYFPTLTHTVPPPPFHTVSRSDLQTLLFSGAPLNALAAPVYYTVPPSCYTPSPLPHQITSTLASSMLLQIGLPPEVAPSLGFSLASSNFGDVSAQLSTAQASSTPVTRFPSWPIGLPMTSQEDASPAMNKALAVPLPCLSRSFSISEGGTIDSAVPIFQPISASACVSSVSSPVPMSSIISLSPARSEPSNNAFDGFATASPSGSPSSVRSTRSQPSSEGAVADSFSPFSADTTASTASLCCTPPSASEDNFAEGRPAGHPTGSPGSQKPSSEAEPNNKAPFFRMPSAPFTTGSRSQAPPTQDVSLAPTLHYHHAGSSSPSSLSWQPSRRLPESGKAEQTPAAGGGASFRKPPSSEHVAESCLGESGYTTYDVRARLLGIEEPQPGQRYVDEDGNVYEYVLTDEDAAGELENEELSVDAVAEPVGVRGDRNDERNGEAPVSERQSRNGELEFHVHHNDAVTQSAGDSSSVGKNNKTPKKKKISLANLKMPKTKSSKARTHTTLLGQLLSSRSSMETSLGDRDRSIRDEIPLTSHNLFKQLTASCFFPLPDGQDYDVSAHDLTPTATSTPKMFPSTDSAVATKSEFVDFGTTTDCRMFLEESTPHFSDRLIKSSRTPERRSSPAKSTKPETRARDIIDKISVPLKTEKLIPFKDKKRSRIGRRRPQNPHSGYPGVSWNCRMQAWLAFFVDPMGTRRSRTFKCNKLGGVEKARTTAVQWLMNKHTDLRMKVKVDKAENLTEA